MNRHAATLIRASAGTGKTFQLTNRLIELLAMGEEPDRILATTFTRKAAGEILERLFRRLAEGALDKDKARELSDFIGVESLDSGRCGELFQHLVAKQNRLSICTLDSFFIQIANSFAYDLKLSAGLQILEGVQEKVLLDEAIRLAISSQPLGRIVELIRLLPKGELTREVHAQLESSVSSLLSLYFEAPQDAWGFSQIPSGPSVEELKSAIEDFAKVEIPLTKSGSPNKRWLKAHEEALLSFAANDWEGFLGKGFIKPILAGEDSFFKVEISSRIRELSEVIISHVRSELVKKWQSETLAIYALVSLVAERFEELKRETGRVGFGDVKRILAHWKEMGELDHIYYRLDNKIKHILLDEFQDTSADEWRVVQPLIDEIMSKASPEHSFFCVGDVKQAIYGWRGGVSEVFDEVEKLYPHLNKEELNVSYRSSPEIVAFTNLVFGGIGKSEVLCDYRTYVEEWGSKFFQHETALTNQPGFVRVETTVHPKEGQSRRVLTLQVAAQRVKKLCREMPDATFGVLLRTNDSVRRMRFELGRGDDGIVASEEGGNPLTDSSAVEVFMSLFQLLDHPSDSIALYHVSTSPLGEALGLTDRHDSSRCEKILEKLRQDVQTESLPRALLRLVGEVSSKCGVRDRTRLEQLVELSYRFKPFQATRLSEFVRYVRETRVEYPVPAQVRVMTVHQAKGLEFDVVVLPELDGKLKGIFTEIVKSRPSALAPANRILKNVNETLRSLSPELEEINKSEIGSQIRESLCFLYVALTRARNAMYVFMEPRGEQEKKMPLTFSSLIKEALGVEGGRGEREILYENGNPAGLVFGESGSVAIEHSPIEKGISFKSGSSRKERIARRAPSRSGKSSSVEKLIVTGEAFALKRGRAVHKCFECLGWVEEGIPEAADLEEILESIEVDRSIVDGAIKDFLKSVSGPEIQEFLSRSRYESRGYEELDLYRELPFVVGNDGRMLRGCFDRLVVCLSGGVVRTVEIIDFKTGKISRDESASSNLAGYQAQIEDYRTAVTELFGVQKNNVSCFLIYPDSQTILPIHQPSSLI